MARPFPLETVRVLSQTRTGEAARVLQDHSARTREANAKLEKLHHYQEEYRVAKATELARGITAQRLREYDGFLARLEEAIEVQAVEAARAHAIWETARLNWLEARRREQAMDALAARHSAGEAMREERLDRKAQDEFAARLRPNPMKIRFK